MAWRARLVIGQSQWYQQDVNNNAISNSHALGLAPSHGITKLVHSHQGPVKSECWSYTNTGFRLVLGTIYMNTG